ncbi:hypothetical protein, partial [Parabacteroides johnsonii]|uniref:hypothetical protein n=1 Tax=Parabacteroides johnsonii TaxID=387661 RepID=UPI00056A240E
QSWPLSLECGCKSRTKISFMQMFGKVFYIFFYSEEWILYGTHMRDLSPFLGNKEIKMAGQR